jgi:two-component system response regulator RegA
VVDRVGLSGGYQRGLILVVDDDSLVLEAYRRLLSRDYRVITATNIASAARLLETEQPDIAIVDLRLGTSSGIDLVRLLRRTIPACKIALVSARATVDIAVLAMQAGADLVALKPISPRQVLRRLAHGPPEPDLEHTLSLERIEYEHISQTMAELDHNVSKAARVLGVHRHTIQRKLRQAPSR